MRMEKKRITAVAEKFGISPPSAKKYINMTEGEIQDLDMPTNYKKRVTIMDDYINIIFKMLRDGIGDDGIYFYILRQGYSGSINSLWEYIKCIEMNNFPERVPMNPKYLLERAYPDDVIVIKRTALLKYLVTRNPKIKKDEIVEKYISIIKEKYPATLRVEEIFHSFHGVIMGTEPDELDKFIEKYQESEIAAFCNGIRKDIAPVKNAISYPVSSGFVEGNNNKFKLLKRIVYGRSGLVNLTKKCKLAFMPHSEDFSLSSLI